MFRQSATLLKQAPLRKTRDPLLSSSQAQHYLLENGNSFIVRPPPSILPPTVPITTNQQGQEEAEEDPFLKAFSTSSSLPILSRSSPASTTSIFPPSTRKPRTSQPPSSTTSLSQLTPSQISEIQQLRRLDPLTNNRSSLSKRFQVTKELIGRVGYGNGVEAREAERVVKSLEGEKKEEREASWGWKKSIAREERRRRRSLW